MPGDELLRFLLKGEEPVLVENHFHPLFPHFPGLPRDLLVDALAERSGPRRRVKTGQLALELDAEHRAVDGLLGGGHQQGDSFMAGDRLESYLSPGGFAPADPPTASLAGPLKSPLRSAELTR